MEPSKDEGRVTLTQMLKVLDKDVSGGIEKRLKRLSKKKLIEKPLDKNKADQLERAAAYTAVSKNLSKWEPIVDSYKRARHLEFPLDVERDVLPTTSESVSVIKPVNKLEEEVRNVIQSSESLLRDDKELTKAEEKYLEAISVEEAQKRHKELQRMRVLLSSYGAKMRRQKAIKSKSYRRLLKHERVRRHVKKVESDKALLMDEIERLQRLRAQERASLKHKNTGKWAKHAKFRAKYDDEARKAMLEQIGLSEKLLEKPALSDESDEEEGDSISEVSEESSSEDQEDSENKKRHDDEKQATRLIVSNELINEKLSRKRKRSNNSDSDRADGEHSNSEGDADADADEEEDDQRKLMREAFADDDVVAEFQKAKERLVDEEQPKDIDKFLPGWGGWAGPGIRINRRLKKKYLIKAEKIPRRDDKLGNVIIAEKADDAIKELMVKKLPRGIKSDERLTRIITRPTSANFVSQSTHRETVKPRIHTKMGARIEPMNRSLLRGDKSDWV